MSDMKKIMDEEQVVRNKIDASNKLGEAELTKALTFMIDDKVYGVEIPHIVEIIGVPHITKVPGVPYYIKGIINVRSKVVPVVNVRSRFGIPEAEIDDKTCTIITEYKDVTIGLIVDRVLEVVSVTQKRKADVPALEQVNDNKFIQYILKLPDGGVKMILDVKKLIFDNNFSIPTDDE